jgi:hypothetical protein
LIIKKNCSEANPNEPENEAEKLLKIIEGRKNEPEANRNEAEICKGRIPSCKTLLRGYISPALKLASIPMLRCNDKRS